MPTDRDSMSRTFSGPVLGAALLGGSALLGLPGCVGYTTYPAASWQIASDNMNGPPADEIMIESVRWAVDRYETDSADPIAINLPDVVEDRTYRIIAFRAGELVLPLDRSTADLPTYHLTRLWVRGDKAEVDLLRPVDELGDSPTGRPIIQAVTVYLEGGLHQWRVERARHWKIGTDAVPALHYYGEGDEPMLEPEDGAADGDAYEAQDGPDVAIDLDS